MRDFQQIQWDAAVEEDCRQIVRLAMREDLDRAYDWTTVALVAADCQGRAAVVARRSGVIAGLPAAAIVVAEVDPRLKWEPVVGDGSAVEAGRVIAQFAGPARGMLTAERPLLNLIGHLSGIATLTQRFVSAVAGTQARIYDTRKTLPAWRRLEKYAVHCGGGKNHRTGLFDAILIKDNHLALGGAASGDAHFTAAEAVARARAFVRDSFAGDPLAEMLVEIEVDTLAQLDAVLAAEPDIVLLDNMSLEQLTAAVARRDAVNRGIQLEASGGVNLESVRAIAVTGVDRISVGALTHSGQWFDVGLDWQP